MSREDVPLNDPGLSYDPYDLVKLGCGHQVQARSAQGHMAKRRCLHEPGGQCWCGNWHSGHIAPTGISTHFGTRADGWRAGGGGGSGTTGIHVQEQQEPIVTHHPDGWVSTDYSGTLGPSEGFVRITPATAAQMPDAFRTAYGFTGAQGYLDAAVDFERARYVYEHDMASRHILVRPETNQAWEHAVLDNYDAIIKPIHDHRKAVKAKARASAIPVIMALWLISGIALVITPSTSNIGAIMLCLMIMFGGAKSVTKPRRKR